MISNARAAVFFLIGYIIFQLLTGCTPRSTGQQVCFARAETEFWVVVEDCKRLGLSYDECLPLIPAEKKLKERMNACK
jgi:hypothetical protein